MRRLNNLNAYKVNTNNGGYTVVIERMKNDMNGNARYKVIGISESLYTFVYSSVKGMFSCDQDIADHVVNAFEAAEGLK